MKQEDINKIIKAVEHSIDKRVNGKIDLIEIKIDAMNKKYEPVYEVYDTANNLGRFVRWVAGFLVAGAVVYLYIKKIFIN